MGTALLREFHIAMGCGGETEGKGEAEVSVEDSDDHAKDVKEAECKQNPYAAPQKVHVVISADDGGKFLLKMNGYAFTTVNHIQRKCDELLDAHKGWNSDCGFTDTLSDYMHKASGETLEGSTKLSEVMKAQGRSEAHFIAFMIGQDFENWKDHDFEAAERSEEGFEVIEDYKPWGAD